MMFRYVCSFSYKFKISELILVAIWLIVLIMDQGLSAVGKQELATFGKYLGSLWMFLQVQQQRLQSELARERNQDLLTSFASDYAVHFLILQKGVGDEVRLEVEWQPDMLSTSNVLLIKKKNFNMHKDLTAFKVAEMLQVVNLDFANEADPMGVAYHYINKLLMPMLGLYKNEFQKKSTADKNTFNGILRRVNQLNFSIAQCQEMVSVPEVRLELRPAVKDIVVRKQVEKYLAEPDLLGSDELALVGEDVTRWNKDIDSLVKHQFDLANSTSLQEQLYWSSYLAALRDVEGQVESEGVKLCISLLKKKNKFHLTTAFDSIIAGLKKMAEKATDINGFFKQIQFQQLMTSQSIDELSNILVPILSHIKKLNNTKEGYDPKRVYQLIEVLSKDIANQMNKILAQENLMFSPFPVFKSWFEKAEEVFKKFEESMSAFMSKKSTTSSLSKIISNTTSQIKTVYHYGPLKTRLEQLFKIRELHHKLKTVIEDIISKSNEKDFLSTATIEDGYNNFKGVNVLDTSKDGEEGLLQAEKLFNTQIDVAESYITKKLREKLGGSSNANQMFRIFSKFNGLFFRPRIKSAIEEYQSQLLKTVKESINLLDKKFLQSYYQTENIKLCKVRDLPNKAGSIVWAKQIKNKLEKYNDKIKEILMENWAEHPEGRECKNKIEALLKKLNTETIMKEWDKETNVILKNNELNKKQLFKLIKKNKYEVAVNFQTKYIDLIKEIRSFDSIQPKKSSVLWSGKTLIDFYPFVVSLQESIRSYHQVSAKIDEKVIKLVAEKKRAVMNCINQGFNTFWNENNKNVEKYSKNLAEVVLDLHQMQGLVCDKYQIITSTIQSLSTCPLKAEVLSEKLKAIQEIIDQFSTREVSNLHIWVPELNLQLEAIFVKRLESLIKEWVNEFISFTTGEDQEESKFVFVTEGMRLELKSENNVFFLDPPLEHAKFVWTQQFHRIVGLICSLPRLESDKYQGSLVKKDKGKQNYENVLFKVNPEVLQSAYREVFNIFQNAEDYLKIWFNYEALWVIDAKKIYERLGDDINRWQALLNEIRENRRTFDNSQTEKCFGPLIIDYRLVLNKINTKYDSWHNQILGHFGEKFGETLKSFFNSMGTARAKLQKINFQNLSADIVQMVNEFQTIKRKYLQWAKEVQKFDSSNKLLERQRYKYPTDWLELDKVMIQWSNLRQIYNRKASQLQNEMDRLKEKVINDEKNLNNKIADIESQWNRDKPSTSADIHPRDALSKLEILNNSIVKVKDSYFKCCEAKELLGLEPGNMQRLENLREDIELLREVWNHLQVVWAPYESIRDTLITAVTLKKIKDLETESVKQLNKTPAKLKQNQPFQAMKLKVGIPGGSYYTMNKKIIELKEECMKPRHWKSLLAKLNINIPQNEVTFGRLWKADLNRNDTVFREIMTVAIGEMVLENMLAKVKEVWLPRQFQLVRYQGKCNLIRGWDEMFEQLDEDLNNLASMKLSQFYRTFEEEIAQWDDKLQKVRITLDVWIDVQRKWVYLESIFLGSSDIKEMLFNEYTRFKSIDSEFTSLMKKVSSKPNIIETMNIQGLQKTLTRIIDMLSNIQKALSDYLQTQRAAFARFYFVGDDDLLEIIGNSKDVAIVQKHFTKMYAGITALQNQKGESGDLILRMLSREGQIVDFKKPVNITEDPKINVWLTKVDNQMRLSLATFLEEVMTSITKTEEDNQNLNEGLLKIIERNPAQVVLLGLQTLWSKKVEDALIEGGGDKLAAVEQYVMNFLTVLATNVVADLKKDLRQKFEQAITDFVHQRDVIRKLIANKVDSNKVFAWLYFMRMIYFPKEQDTLKKLSIQMANANFHYGFEYLGVGQKLVQTPLTDRCFLTLTQAIHLRMGGAPFGPAGTGKTESVKALGSQLGYFVLVFNCDETFDFHAMGRIFIGLCQVGAWGCFDEFNRLEQRMLSACSQQILVIQTGLRERQSKIELMGKDVRLNPQVGSFVTMNPGYAGRSNLPENLKQLFRQMAMVKPDRELIAQVMLYSQGYKTAEQLAGKIVSLFELCNDQLSSQPHYDFGLRALKSVLVSAGNMKREAILNLKKENQDVNSIKGRDLEQFQQKILLRSVCETLVPKLIADDIPLLANLLQGVFPGSTIPTIREPELRENIVKVAKMMLLQPEESFIEKVLQLYQIQRLHHGLMMVGPSGCGKSKAWQVLMNAMERTDKVKGESYVIDPKAITKDQLYGRLDNTTLEWTDGIFTGVLRKITENQRGESSKRHWIIFDGDVDPQWAENLNSVLDDNKLLTLSNGERIQIPPNVRIMFEVQTLKYATLATVSRCGMVWFSEEVISPRMIFNHYLLRLKQDDYDRVPKVIEEKKEEETNVDSDKFIRERCVQAIDFLFLPEDCFCQRALAIAAKLPHVMEFTIIRVTEATFALIRKGISNVLEYNEMHSEIPLEDEILSKYIRKWTLQSIMWGVGGSLTLKERGNFSRAIADILPTHQIQLPAMLDQIEGQAGVPYILIDFQVRIEDGEWALWKKKVPTVQIDPQKVTDADVIIPTVDTLRHQEVLCSWLSEHRPFLLCGPPGSGKTMTLMSTLKALPEFEMIFVNFSSSTNPGLIMKQFEHYCEYNKTVSGIVLRPKQPSKWLVVFCDQINLPDSDKYGTMTVITFLRQLTQQHGFWRTTDRQWISLQRIQFVGACNPPTDIGRKPLNPRFLRHCPLILVDFPGFDSLKQIFGTFNKAMLKKSVALRQYSQYLTNAMVEFYTQSQKHFTADIQPHYIYSPRELTRWKYAINEAIDTIDNVDDLVRLWAHEALRLFEDRLVLEDEKQWCEKLIDQIAARNFPSLSQTALERPILFSNYLTKNYVSVDRAELKKYVEARLKIFYEQQLNVPIVVFDEVLEHILRIDRVLRQPLGHLLLVGASGVGKTTLSRFVSWLNNISVFQIKAGRNYSLQDFDEDLRNVMKRAGVKQEKICFIFDESNCLSPAFLEKMNALLASGQIPGLFEGEEYMLLLSQFKESNSKNITNDDEIYKLFIKNVQRNLHVVFTMNPSNPDFSNRTASSPALFNRCVIDWFGDWSEQGLYQVAKEFTLVIDPVPESFDPPILEDEARHGILINTIVGIHSTVIELNKKLSKSAKKFNYITPRDFLDLIKHFVELYNEKKSMLEDQQYHLNVGLDKLKQTQAQVLEMQGSLDLKKAELEKKEKEASEKMTLIVQEKTKAKEKQEESSKLKVVLEAKGIQISAKRQEVEADLAKAEPALISAKKNVENINSNDLNTIKSYAKPPANVELALKPIYYMVNKVAKFLPAVTRKELTWGDIKSMMGSNFTKQIQELKADDIEEKVKDYVLKEFIRSDNWKLENITKASAAAGALAGWAESQLAYADILTRVDPMKKEIAKLQEEGSSLQKQAQQLARTIDELEKKTKLLQQQYETLIREKQEIVTDMAKVEDKVSRSKKLLNNLSSEKYRWEDTSKNFKVQLASVLGDVFLSSAFLAYIGFFDHYYRKLLSNVWRSNLTNNRVKFREQLLLIEFLSNPNERLIWRSHKLPSDDLCTENAIIMKRYHKYPLIIDPAGQAMEYLLSLLADKSFILSSFADDAFLKNLEKSLRFGRPLLVQDVEKIEPILNSVLNKEVYKTGGMVLIRVGDQEIDFNPNFTMFMITRNSNAKFTPDLCSRVTFVNFTITSSSLEDQCLNIFLRNERPDVEQKRISLMKIQGEYIVKLRELQDSLLDALSNVQGSILESESVISTLEKLKTEASKITEQMKKSNTIMTEVQNVTNGYKPIAQAASKVYFALESMSSLHYLYEYSLTFFMDTILKLLDSDEKLRKVDRKDYEKRKDTIYSAIFERIFLRVANSLLSKDLIIFCLKLVSIKLKSEEKALFDAMIKPTAVLTSRLSTHFLRGLLNQQQLKQIEQLTQHPIFNNLIDLIQGNQHDWLDFLNSANPEQKIPKIKSEVSAVGKQLISLILIKIFRPDKFNPIAYQLVKVVLGEECREDYTVDFKSAITACKSKEPILLSSAPGFDPSFKVEQLSKETNSKLISVAIGSAEGFELADRAMKEGVKTGSWIMLKNVHLAPSWLSELEKKIHVLTPHANFRLFLTAEFSPKIPSTLIRQSYKLVFEPAAGIKASLIRTYKTVLSPSRSDRLPVERSRLHFLLGWLHAVILQRLRYTPIGWTKVYEFNEADQRCGLDLIDEYIDAMGSRNNIDINKIPWDAFKTILIENLYGGKIDNEYDSKILVSLVEMFFTPESFDSSYPLFRTEDPGETILKMPDGIKFSQFLNWVEKMPDLESPTWSGLPPNVEKLLKSSQTARAVSELHKLQDVNEEEVTLEKKKEEKKNSQLKWLSEVNEKVTKYSQILPKELRRLQRTEELMNNPLFRFLEREVTVASKLLNNIQRYSGDIKDMTSGKSLATNVLRQLCKQIHSDSIPKMWVSFTIDTTINLTNYIIDLQKRFEQFNKLISLPSYQNSGVWFGGLLFPEAYMTATRQFVAQRNGWSLEELELKTEKLSGQTLNEESLLMTNMRIEGGNWSDSNEIVPIGQKQDIGKSLPPMLMRWSKVASKTIAADEMMVPVYLNRTRKNLIMSLKVKCGNNKTILYQKGIAIILWTN